MLPADYVGKAFGAYILVSEFGAGLKDDDPRAQEVGVQAALEANSLLESHLMGIAVRQYDNVGHILVDGGWKGLVGTGVAIVILILLVRMLM